MAGKLIAVTMPLTTSSAITIHSSAMPLITRKATAPWVRAESRPESCMISARSKRSEITPPNRRKSTIGTVWAARTRPSALAESLMSRTANASATVTIIEPVIEAIRAA